MLARGERVELLEQDRRWVPCRVRTGAGEGVAGVLLVLRRLTDGQRLLLDSSGKLVEVPG